MGDTITLRADVVCVFNGRPQRSNTGNWRETTVMTAAERHSGNPPSILGCGPAVFLLSAFAKVDESSGTMRATTEINSGPQSAIKEKYSPSFALAS